jgi:hypothetical protein
VATPRTFVISYYPLVLEPTGILVPADSCSLCMLVRE